mmetsp:Transcript_2689/g.8025  ORF Transcript_2689/g.8025 Transcript_2689/m.8025 type:complete len:235 (-) Transcript_2689:1874-2578(-)
MPSHPSMADVAALKSSGTSMALIWHASEIASWSVRQHHRRSRIERHVHTNHTMSAVGSPNFLRRITSLRTESAEVSPVPEPTSTQALYCLVKHDWNGEPYGPRTTALIGSVSPASYAAWILRKRRKVHVGLRCAQTSESSAGGTQLSSLFSRVALDGLGPAITPICKCTFWSSGADPSEKACHTESIDGTLMKMYCPALNLNESSPSFSSTAVGLLSEALRCRYTQLLLVAALP